MNKNLSENNPPYKLDYYYPNQKFNFLFTQIPDFLFKDPFCKKISSNAKLLYGKLLRETRLAEKNKQIDDQNRLYIDFSLSKTCEFLNCSEATAKRVRKELRDCFGEKNGLVQYVSHGQGKSDYIYVMNYIPESVTPIITDKTTPIASTTHDPSREVKNEPSREIIHEPPRELKSDPYIKENNKESFKKDNIYHLSFTNSAPGKTDDDQRLPFSPVSVAKTTTPDRYATALEDFKTQIDYEQLLCYASDKTTLIDDMIEVIAQEYVSSSAETIINGRHYSRTAIMDCLKSIDLPTAKYALDCLGRSNTKVINIQRYILATLLNAPASFKAQKAYEDQVRQNRFLSPDTGPIYVKPTIKRSYEPYQGRSYTDEEIHAFELKKLGITG